MISRHIYGLGVVGLMGMASTAGAGVLSLNTTFGFTDLSTSYNASTGEYLAQSSLVTSGDVTLWNGAPPLTAEFLGGTIGVDNIAFVEFRMDIDNILGSSADGLEGRLLIRDMDGDNLAGSFEGTWDFVGGFGFFDGIVSFAQYNGGGNGIYEGTGGGDEFVIPGDELSGAISFLIQMPEWFDAGGFEDRSSQGDGMLFIPTPGSLSLLAVGGLVATRRRRA